MTGRRDHPRPPSVRGTPRGPRLRTWIPTGSMPRSGRPCVGAESDLAIEGAAPLTPTWPWLAAAAGRTRPRVSSPATESIGELARRPPAEGAVSARRGRGTARDGVRHLVRREGCGERNACQRHVRHRPTTAPVPGKPGRDQSQLWKRQSTSFLRTRALTGRGARWQSHPCCVDLGFEA